MTTLRDGLAQKVVIILAATNLLAVGTLLFLVWDTRDIAIGVARHQPDGDNPAWVDDLRSEAESARLSAAEAARFSRMAASDASDAKDAAEEACEAVTSRFRC